MKSAAVIMGKSLSYGWTLLVRVAKMSLTGKSSRKKDSSIFGEKTAVKASRQMRQESTWEFRAMQAFV